MVLNRIIYPWEIPCYEKAGVNSIKLVGRDHPKPELVNKIKAYMLGAADPEYALNEFYNTYNSRFMNKVFHPYGTLKMKEIFEFLPKLDYFMEKKPQCAAQCGATCKYCFNKAEQLETYVAGKGQANPLSCTVGE
jgi:collagenase-like PrtC family protease